MIITYDYKRNGYGQYKILCTVNVKNEIKTFSHHTTDSSFIDNINSLSNDDVSYYEIQNLYNEKFFKVFEENILELCN